MFDLKNYPEVKYFTKVGQNLTQQSKIYRDNPQLAERLKQEAATLDQRREERISAMQSDIERRQKALSEYQKETDPMKW